MENRSGIQLTNKNHRSLPVLSYYLAFIHYFGYSINPDDDHHSRYLSIRVKRAKTQLVQEQDQWLASYTRRAQKRINSLPVPLVSFLKTTIKFTAIGFTTFIAMNHCIVLIDYIYQGSKGLEDVMLDVRLVITKLSALIFVASWHHKRSEVRQLIKLVKSTSMYILATHGIQQQQQHQQQQGLPVPLESPCASPTVLEGTKKGNNFCLDQTTRRKNNNMTAEEIGSSLKLDTGELDRRIMKWWLFCCSISIVHFSLSEAEISVSHHLWQWLDDYSLHQLSNETTSLKTLMFLASFDNYIYTVHVYGTRLIGASIICIVCSLQHEVIKSLNLYTLRLIRRSSQPLLRGCCLRRSHFKGISNGGGKNMRVARGRNRQTGSSGAIKWLHYHNSNSFRWLPRVGDRFRGDSQTTLLVEDNDKAKASASSVMVDPDAFFILGQSYWLRVKENRHQLEPCGHLSASIFWLWKYLTTWFRFSLQLTSEACSLSVSYLRAKLCKLGWTRRQRRVGSMEAEALAAKSHNCRVTPKSAELDDSAGDSSTYNYANNTYVNFPPVTSTLGQLASSLISSNNNNNCTTSTSSAASPPIMIISRQMRPTPHDRPPTPALLHQATNGLYNDELPSRFRHASVARYLSQQSNTYQWNCSTNPLVKVPFVPIHYNHPPFLVRRGHYRPQLKLGDTIVQLGQNDDWKQQQQQQQQQQPPSHQSPGKSDSVYANQIEMQMERLGTKYELVRTVNARIDSCFGPMLLIQFLFLFLMSCIDVVFFSLYFSPNTKTKYIIISGMILLWCPYLLIYKFSSDMGSSSKQLLASVRRLARLYLIEHQAYQATMKHSNKVNNSGPWNEFLAHKPDDLRPSFKFNQHGFSFQMDSSRDKAASTSFETKRDNGKIGAGFLDKLDYVFKPTNLSIMGIMTVDKFFLLNFAKIVITSSVMMIQFISN